VSRFYNDNFVAFKLNGDSDQDPALTEKLAIEAFPTLIYFAPDGTEITRTEGALNPQAFLEFGRKAFDLHQKMPAMKQAYEKNPNDMQAAKNYLLLLAENNASEVGQPVAKAYFNKIKNESELKQSDNWKIIKAFCKEGASREYEYVAANMPDYFAIDPEGLTEFVYESIEKSLSKAVAEKDKSILEPGKKFFAAFVAASTTDSKAVAEFNQLLEMNYYKSTGQRKEYFDIFEKWVDETKADDLEGKTKTVWQLCQETEDAHELQTAERWVKEIIEKDNTSVPNFIYSAILLSLKRFDEFDAQIQKTEKLDADEEFGEYIEQMKMQAAEERGR
jgi:hypothetical protein